MSRFLFIGFGVWLAFWFFFFISKRYFRFQFAFPLQIYQMFTMRNAVSFLSGSGDQLDENVPGSQWKAVKSIVHFGMCFESGLFGLCGGGAVWRHARSALQFRTCWTLIYLLRFHWRHSSLNTCRLSTLVVAHFNNSLNTTNKSR